MHCVDLGESFPTSIYLVKSASIQPRTSPSKFGGNYSILFIRALRHDHHGADCGEPRTEHPQRDARAVAAREGASTGARTRETSKLRAGEASVAAAERDSVVPARVGASEWGWRCAAQHRRGVAPRAPRPLAPRRGRRRPGFEKDLGLFLWPRLGGVEGRG